MRGRPFFMSVPSATAHGLSITSGILQHGSYTLNTKGCYVTGETPVLILLCSHKFVVTPS
jgi:hypothetical protein